ncbi:HNH endonuclease signature motif containing protein [Mycobacterium sp. ITM-2016-00318]|uniref:HNH endonuclease signature motif containing protein n=1 Tax=Mycobacterium sp. ITM-2016-00318 TaxID=2099693 RepID=UPI000CF991FC|nr:HNH endonuclease signature motif containing protein [Mycobacterium sp. ITM-2016-00318]WNG93206.1 DUF222 domain-containing protein [Mycobacterium sp. ITM-2016-00318]
MFDGSVPEIADVASLTDAELVDAAGGWVRAENGAGARKLAVMAEIFARRTRLSSAQEREWWWIDPDAAVAAELAAVLSVSSGMALHQTNRGVALRDRLPRVAALFAAGLLSDLLVRAIVSRTYLIEDHDAMAAVDAELADRVTRWGALSVKKTEEAIDALVDEHDPGALRRTLQAGAEETVQFGCPSDVAGTTTIWARVNSPDAVLMEQSVEDMAHSVCDGDVRSMDQRRAHALAAKVNGTAFACRCGEPDCHGGTTGDAPLKNATVYVVADEKSVDAVNAAKSDAVENATEPAETAVDAEADAEQCTAPPAYVFGGGILPTPLLGGILERATIREVRHPGGNPRPEPRYTPSRQLAEFVRCRDLTCRYPNCDKPAQVCEIDHTVPYPVGPTHPSNLKCLCGFHHMLKTFWVGFNGWSEKQRPDGTVVWTLPTGHTRTTYPGSLHLFPQLCEPTTTLWPGEPPVVEAVAGRGMKMPKRRHTRAANTAKAKAAERKLNDDLVAERNKPPPF